MSFFVDKLGPLPGEQSRKEQKSVGSADLLKHPSKAKAQPAKGAPARAQAERNAPGKVIIDRSPPPKDEPKKKKGWFG